MKYFVQVVALFVVPLAYFAVLCSFEPASMDQLKPADTHIVQSFDYPSYTASQR